MTLPHSVHSVPPWPLADSEAFVTMDEATRRDMARYITAALERDVIATWFRHGVDRERGGFVTDLDRRWRPRGPQQRMLEFQARQTRSAARLAMAFPSQARWREDALHGFRFLRDVMWDREHGGWFWLLDRAGTPLADGSKHSHGTAYAIGACFEVYRATGETAALELALEGFRWLDDSLHDDEFGGFHGWARRDGTPVLSVEDSPDGRALVDPLGHGVGHKDINVTSDIFEMLADSLEYLPEQPGILRLRELRDCISGMITPDGGLQYAAYPNWVPVPGPERYGYHFLTAFRLVRAAPLLGTPMNDALAQACLLATHAVERGWLPGGGFAYGGPAAPPDALEGTSLVVRSRQWWVQLEGLKVLLLLAAHGYPAKDTFAAKIEQQIAFIERECRDHRFGGWYQDATGDHPLLKRLAVPIGLARRAKGGVWKDGSHETDTYLTVLRMMAGLSLDAPLERPG